MELSKFVKPLIISLIYFDCSIINVHPWAPVKQSYSSFWILSDFFGH
jgi:hypothetical protein